MRDYESLMSTKDKMLELINDMHSCLVPCYEDGPQMLDFTKLRILYKKWCNEEDIQGVLN